MAPRILIIEDDNFLRTAYMHVLEKENFEVKIASTGREGLSIAESWDPHLIMLDLLMPELDGIGFLKEFDAKNKPQNKIIVFSNMSSPEKVDEAIALGAVNFKTKAMFTPREMIELIRSTIGDTTLAVAPPAEETPPPVAS